MKKDNDKKSRAFYDVETDKSKGIGLKNLAVGNSPIFTKNDKGEIEFEIEVPTSQIEPEKKNKQKANKKKIDEKKDVIEEVEEIEIEEESIESEESEYIDELDNNTDRIKVVKTLFKIIIVSLIVLAIIIIIWGLNSPTFNISKVTIGDTNRVDSNEIRKIVSGDIGNNIFITNLGNMSSKIEKLPYVYKANISRKLPDELDIEILERNELFAISSADGFLFIDQFGYVMAEEQDKSENIPVVQGLVHNSYSVGDTLNGTDITKFKNLKFFVEVANSIDFEYDIVDIDYTNSNDLKFNIANLDIGISYGKIEKNTVNDKLIYLKEIINTCVKNNYKGHLDFSADNYLENAIFKQNI